MWLIFPVREIYAYLYVSVDSINGHGVAIIDTLINVCVLEQTLHDWSNGCEMIMIVFLSLDS